jgi:hypothetical protein
MVRARNCQTRFPHGTDWLAGAYRAMLLDAANSQDQSLMLLGLAKDKTALIAEWAKAVPPALLDREMPRLLLATDDVPHRAVLFGLWQRRGSESAARDFATNHPDLGLNPPHGSDTK